MALRIEDGTGVIEANAYTDVAFVTTYLTDRNRQSENLWQSKATFQHEAAIVSAADFMERRWGPLFLGRKEFLDVSVGRSTLTFTGQPTDTQTVVMDSVTYTFNTSLGGANSILIGASTDASILNLINAVAAVAGEAGTTHGTGTVVHPTMTVAAGLDDTLIASAILKGTPGNGLATTETVTTASWSAATTTGGGDVVIPQYLSFPRTSLRDRDGILVSGIPLKLKQASAEYTVRALAADILPDPTADASGRVVQRKREKIGPIEEETEYAQGSQLEKLFRSYPTADRLLAGYVSQGGGTIRN